MNHSELYTKRYRTNSQTRSSSLLHLLDILDKFDFPAMCSKHVIHFQKQNISSNFFELKTTFAKFFCKQKSIL